MAGLFKNNILFSCKGCHAVLTNNNELKSTDYKGEFGKAYLFRAVVNLKVDQVYEKDLLTGRHFIRDVFCKKCSLKLGWMYEFACEESQRFKEGHVILEKALISETKC